MLLKNPRTRRLVFHGGTTISRRSEKCGTHRTPWDVASTFAPNQSTVISIVSRRDDTYDRVTLGGSVNDIRRLLEIGALVCIYVSHSDFVDLISIRSRATRTLWFCLYTRRMHPNFSSSAAAI